MDPDMVRQQEEAEDEARRIKPASPAPKAALAVMAEPEMLDEEYVEPRPAEPETETVFVHSHAPGLPPILPVRRKKKTAPAAQPGDRVGWFAALRVSIYAVIMAALGLLAGTTLGIQLGLVAMQSLGIGAAFGFLLAWQSAFVSLRANKAISFGWAVLTGVWPAVIVVAALILAMLAAWFFTGITPGTISGAQLREFWIIMGAGALFGLIASTAQTRKLSLR